MLVKNKATHARIISKWLDLSAYNIIIAHDDGRWTWLAMLQAWETMAHG